MIDDNINYEYIIRYIRRSVEGKRGILKELENDIPISQPETIKLIEVLIRFGRAEKILEIGTAIGYSAIAMCSAGASDVTSIEILPEMVDIARENIKKSGFSEEIRVIQGNAGEILKEMEGEFDIIFIDAAKGQYLDYFENCMRLLRSGGLLISDNVLYKGMTATDELVLRRKITIVKRLRKYIELITSHEELDTAIIPIGDGVAISCKM